MTTTDMKRYTSLKSNLFSAHSSSIVSQNLIYMQMSHHYRRLLNAKSNVDSSQPRSFRTQQRPRRTHRLLHIDSSDSSFIDELSPSEMALVDRIVYDDKHSPDMIYRDHMAGKNHNHPYPPAPPRHDCTQSRRGTERPKQNQRCRQSSTQRTANKPASCDLIDRHCDVFECADPYKPRILKSTAQSRVRDLKVYHPPRRKPKLHKTDDWDIQTEVQQQQEEERVMEADDWLQSQTVQTDIEPPRPLCAQCQCDITLEHPSSKVSIGSRDSAYNGGVSSGGESRGPTPEQINLANLSTSIARPIGRCEECPTQVAAVQSVVPSNFVKRNHKDRSSSPLPRRHPMRSTTDRKVNQDKRKNRPLSYSPTRQCVLNSNKMALTDGRVPDLDHSIPRDDVRYAAFSQRITADILCREILSNKGINQVFQRHMEENMDLLDMTLMQKEIDMLRVQLDLGGSEDTNKNIILDSEGSNTPQRASDMREDHKKEGRISSLPLDSSISYMTPLFPISTTYKSNTSNDSSNVSSIRFPAQSEHILSDVLYPSCPAPCTTRYGNLAVHNQLVQAGGYSQNLDIASAPDQNELELLPFEILSPDTTMEDDLNVVETVVETGADGIMDSSSNTSADSSSLKEDIKEMLEQILADNIPSMIAEPEVIEDNNVAVDNEIYNLPSDSESSEKSVASTVKSESPQRSLTTDGEFFRSSWATDHSNSPISQNKPTLENSSNEDPNVASSSSDVQTRCCFIKKKKKSKDAHKPTNVSLPIEKRELGQSNVAASEDKTNTPHNEQLFDNDLSWEAMQGSKIDTPPATSSSLSSKSSLSPVVPSEPVEPPRVRKTSDVTSRRRSTYMEVLSSSSSSTTNSTIAARNFREQVRKSNEAHQIKSDTARLQDFNYRRNP